MAMHEGYNGDIAAKEVGNIYVPTFCFYGIASCVAHLCSGQCGNNMAKHKAMMEMLQRREM